MSDGSISSVGSNAQMQQARAFRNAPDAEAMKARFDDAAQAAGADPSKVADLDGQITAAVDKARQATPGDRGAVRQAINNVLQQNGVDPTKFRSALEASQPKGGAHRAHHHHRSQGSQSGSPTSGANTAQTDEQGPPSSGNGIDIAA